MPLQVFVDGALLPEAEGRAIWARFSEHMETNRGDLAGFAKSAGFASIHPEMRDGAPALIASRKAPQRVYSNAAHTSSAGAGAKSVRPSTNRSGSPKPQNSPHRGPSPQNQRKTKPKR